MTKRSCPVAEKALNNCPKPSAFSQSEIVTIFVGPKRKTFKVHQNLLSSTSKYFEVMFADSSKWKENETKELFWTDKDSDPGFESVEILVDWLYGRDIHCKSSMQLIKCYQLGHEKLMLDFKNTIVDVLRQNYVERKESCRAYTLQACFRAGLCETPIFEFVIKSLIFDVCNRANQRLGEQNTWRATLDNVILEDVDLARIIVANVIDYHVKPWSDPRLKVDCTFHEHPVDNTHKGNNVSNELLPQTEGYLQPRKKLFRNNLIRSSLDLYA